MQCGLHTQKTSVETVTSDREDVDIYLAAAGIQLCTQLQKEGGGGGGRDLISVVMWGEKGRKLVFNTQRERQTDRDRVSQSKFISTMKTDTSFRRIFVIIGN